MIGFAELRRRKSTFAFVIAVVALVAYLVLMVSGLAVGLRGEIAGGLEDFTVDAIAFDADARTSVSQSVLSASQVKSIRTGPGVEGAARLAALTTDYRTATGELSTGTFFGFEPDGVGAPSIVDGRLPDSASSMELAGDRAFLRQSGHAVY